VGKVNKINVVCLRAMRVLQTGKTRRWSCWKGRV